MAKKKEPIKGTTSSGFSYVIDPERLDDYRLFELLSEAMEDAIKMPKFVDKVLGEEQVHDDRQDTEMRMILKALLTVLRSLEQKGINHTTTQNIHEIEDYIWKIEKQ